MVVEAFKRLEKAKVEHRGEEELVQRETKSGHSFGEGSSRSGTNNRTEGLKKKLAEIKSGARFIYMRREKEAAKKAGWGRPLKGGKN